MKNNQAHLVFKTLAMFFLFAHSAEAEVNKTKITPPIVKDSNFQITSTLEIDIGGGSQQQMEQPELFVKSSEATALDSSMKPLSIDSFGDAIDPYSGSLSFHHTDVILPGNSHLEVAIRRSVDQSTKYHPQQSTGFGDWELQLPKIYRKVVQQVLYDSNGWTSTESIGINVVQFGREEPSWQNNRCSTPDIAGPYYQLPNRWATANGGLSLTPNWESQTVVPEWFYPEESYSDGTYISIPGQGAQEILDTPKGSYWGNNTKKITKNNWRFQCISNAIGGGEGFIAIAPNGDRWTFNKLVFMQAPYIKIYPKGTNNFTSIHSISGASYATMLATEVRDVHGNWVKYSYENDGKLKRIYANDGRDISVQYNGKNISSVTAHGRTWRYNYKPATALRPATLEKVTLPDNRYWSFNLGKLYFESLRGKACTLPDFSVSVTNPFGSTADFDLAETVRVRPSRTESRVVNGRCSYDPTTAGWAHNTGWDTVYESVAVTNKAISGPGLPDNSWTYDYNAQFVTVTNPDQSKLGYEFYINGAGEGKSKYRKFYNKNGQLVRTEYFAYQFGPALGQTFRHNRPNLNYKGDIRRSRLIQKKVIENGDSYTSTFSNFDSFGYHQITSEFNSFNSNKRYTKQTYFHDTTNWKIGLPRVTYVSANGSDYKQVHQTKYYSATHAYKSLPQYELSYGRWYKKYTAYHTTGNQLGKLRTVLYNRNYGEISLYDYKRGVPGRIQRRQNNSTSYHDAYQQIDNFGNVTKQTDYEGDCITFDYDNVDRLKKISPCNTYWYDTKVTYSTTNSNEGYTAVEADMLKQTVSKNNYRKVTYLDGLLRPTFIAEWDASQKSNTIRFKRFVHDFDNRITFESQTMGSASTPHGVLTEYDALGRKVKVDDNTTSGNITYSYLSGNRIQTNNNRGKVTTQTYLAYGTPSFGAPVRIQSPQNVTTDLTYNIFGNLRSVSQGGITEHHIYNGYQRLCKITRPDIGNRAFNYNDVGQLTWSAHGDSVSGSSSSCDTIVDNTDKINYAYDNHGNLKTVDYGDNTSTKSFKYDGNDNLLEARFGGVTQNYTYDDLGHIKTERLRVDSIDWTIEHTYDASGARKNLIYPSGGNLSYSPNALGQPKNVGVFATNVTFHPNGTYKSFTHQNGCVNSISLHSSGLPNLQRSLCNGNNAVYNQYTWDANGNLTTWDDKQNSNYDLKLTYDSLDRVDNFRKLNNTLIGDMNYDTMGNITKFDSVVGGALIYDYDSSKRLRSTSGLKSYSFSYDERGNTTDNGRVTLNYNLANQITSIGGNTYVYDAHDKRVRTVDGKGTRYSMYSRSGQLIHERINGANRENYYLGTQLIAHQGAGEKLFIHPDVLGSTAATSNSSRTIKRLRSQPFGQSWGGTLHNEVGYTGHKQDSDTGLIYMQARYYDPVIGRFYSNDPVGVLEHLGGLQGIQGFNRYAYANNNPYKYKDPDGRAVACLTPVTGPICVGAVEAAVNGIGAVIIGGIAVYNEWTDEDDDDCIGTFGCIGSNKGKKGKGFRGGKKKDRDQWGKYSGKKYKDFQKWWEREKQKDSSLNDLETEDERDEAYEDYKADQEERNQQEDRDNNE